LNKLKTTLDMLKTLTPHEAEAVRKRFGVDKKTSNNNSDTTPGHGDDSGGSGGTPVPAVPQK